MATKAERWRKDLMAFRKEAMQGTACRRVIEGEEGTAEIMHILHGIQKDKHWHLVHAFVARFGAAVNVLGGARLCAYGYNDLGTAKKALEIASKELAGDILGKSWPDALDSPSTSA